MSFRNAIILHGKPKRERFESPGALNPSDSNWLPLAKHQLTLAGIFTVTPDLPVPYAPVYADWAREVDKHSIDDHTTMIGHSAGAALALKWLNIHGDRTIDRLVLVAPWLDPHRNYRPEFDFYMRSNLARRIGNISVFYASTDDQQALDSLEIVQRSLPDAHYIDIPAYGHYMIGNSMTGPEFPELIREVS